LVLDKKVILTADRTVMSNYGNSLFYGFLSTAPKKSFKILSVDRMMRTIIKRVPTDDEGRAKIAPQGLRRLESALVGSGVLGADEVAVAPPENLGRMVSGATKVVGITVIDPLGRGPSSSTFGGEYGIIHEETINSLQFRNLMESEVLRRARENGAKVIVGGPGVWQLGSREMERFGIDVLVDGEAELLFPEVIESALDGRLQTPAIIKTDYKMVPEAKQIPPLMGGTIGGVVEISRGCGRGCRFCMPTMRKIRHRSIEEIIADIKTNIAFGQRDICLHAEDVLRYGSLRIEVEPDKVIPLFKAVKEVPGVDMLSVSHTALASIASSPQTVSKISEVLELDRKCWMGFQTGIETGSPKIIQNLMSMKAAPFMPSEWPQVVEDAFAICANNNWVPAATLMVNLPGETESDVIQTTEVVESLYGYKSLIVPLLYVPFGNDETKPMRMIEDAKYYHFELYKAIWRHDMHWLKDLAADYSRTNDAITKMAIGAIVRFVNTIADWRVKAYLDEQIERLRPKEDRAEDATHPAIEA